MNKELFKTSLNKTMNNLPGVIKDWDTLDEDLITNYRDSIQWMYTKLIEFISSEKNKDDLEFFNNHLKSFHLMRSDIKNIMSYDIMEDLCIHCGNLFNLFKTHCLNCEDIKHVILYNSGVSYKIVIYNKYASIYFYSGQERETFCMLYERINNSFIGEKFIKLLYEDDSYIEITSCYDFLEKYIYYLGAMHLS